MADIDQALGHGPALRCGLLFDFVADAPQNNARMVAVATDHRAQVPLAPIVKKPSVTKFDPDLGDEPLVKDFIHHQQSHPVAEIE